MTFAPSSVPLLFLISVFLDNEWEPEQEEKLLDFLVDSLLGRKGLLPDSLGGFIDLITKAQLNFENVNLSSFLLDQVPRLCENRFALESFLKEVGELLISDNPADELASTASVSSRVSSHSLFGIFIKTCLVDFESLSFENQGQFFKNVASYCSHGNSFATYIHYVISFIIN